MDPKSSRRDFARLDTKRLAEPDHRPEASSRPMPLSREEPKSPRSRLSRWLRRGVLLMVLGLLSIVVSYWAVVFYFEHKLPDIFTVQDYLESAQEMSRVLGSKGEVLEELGEQKRTVALQEEIPELVKQAVLAAEDADFYTHGGLDYWGMARAMWRNIRQQRIREGASTITQQVAKTFFLSSERTISRKLREVVLARELEKKLSKDEILFLYLNQIYWGHGRYGVREAAQFYFGKTLAEVTLADAALLAGLIAAPERFSPFNDEQKARERRAFVLDQMAKHSFATSEATQAAKHEPIKLNFAPTPELGVGAYAVAMVDRVVVEKVGEARMKRGGLRIYTTIDTRMQRAAELAMQKGLEDIDLQYGLARPIEQLPTSRIPDRIEQLRRLHLSRGIRSGEVVLGVVTAKDTVAKYYVVNVGFGACRLPFAGVRRYTEGVEPEALFEVGDVIRVSPRLALTGPWADDAIPPLVNLDLGPQGALVAIDPRTREVKSLVGGYDFDTHPFNRASMARRQAGSTFKPFVYAAALEAGVIEPTTRFDNVPESYRVGPHDFWTPRNYSGTYDGRSYTARLALAKSINVIAVKALEKVGLKKFTEFVHRIGIRSDIAQDLSVALGSTAVSPFELANAYATLASGGLVGDVTLVTRIEDARGNVLWEAKPVRARGTTAEVSYRITEMMEAVVTSGTAKSLQSLGRPIAGKTGTTDKGIDTWFAGYTPELVTVVWVGFDDMRAVDKATGGTIAAPLWQRFVASALETTAPTPFTRPSGLKALGPIEDILPGRSAPVLVAEPMPDTPAGHEDAPAGGEAVDAPAGGDVPAGGDEGSPEDGPAGEPAEPLPSDDPAPGAPPTELLYE